MINELQLMLPYFCLATRKSAKVTFYHVPGWGHVIWTFNLLSEGDKIIYDHWVMITCSFIFLLPYMN